MSSSAGSPEVLVPFKGEAAPLTKVRGTLLVSSMKALRDRGRLDDYFAALPVSRHESMRTLVAASWVPVDVALAHYRACDALQLPDHDLLAIGAEAFNFSQGAFLSVAARVATHSGVTPWAVLEQVRRVYDRIFIGGDIAVTRVGPKEARIDFRGWPFATTRYNRVAMRGLLSVFIALFCQRAFCTEQNYRSGSSEVSFRIAWV